MTAQVQPAMLMRLDAAWLTQYIVYTCLNSLRHFFDSVANLLSHEVENSRNVPPMHDHTGFLRERTPDDNHRNASDTGYATPAPDDWQVIGTIQPRSHQ